MLVPDDLRETANRLSCALGHDTLPGDLEPVASPDRLTAIVGLDTPEALAILGLLRIQPSHTDPTLQD